VSESIWDEMEAAITYEAVKKAHVTSLRTSVSPRQRVAYLSQLAWSVVSLDAGSLIFGDVGPLAYVAGNHTYESLVEVDPTRAPVVTLPLSDRCLLVGASGAYPAPLDTEELNAAAAELSLNFFVASKNTPSEQSLGHRIGTRLDSAWLHLMTGAEGRFLELADSVLQAGSESGDSKSS
jgi:hypothetical protein